MQEELAPEQIASMSEVIAEYMGRIFTIHYGKYRKVPCCRIDEKDDWDECKYHSSWDWLHEVWDKVSSEDVDGMNQYWYQIELALCGNEKQETFWALHRAIIYINQLKQSENDNNTVPDINKS